MRLAIVAVLIGLLLPATAFATAQFGDRITYKGETVEMFSNPLESYFSQERPRPDHLFKATCTACWRGYVGHWEVKDDQLVLVKLVAGDCGQNSPEIPLESLFPGQKGPIVAIWFTGIISIPQGKMLQYVHMGYQSVFEKELLLNFKDGKLIKEEIIDNSKVKFDSNGMPVPEAPPQPPTE